ncbi:MAG: Uncharacterised protein [Prochlorococcus marinus str. MIT 9215]|jgi:hypothetical protein|nr:MAG: Uncharacterised protein [Prochlorococcus marinus str. MIT 9215]
MCSSPWQLRTQNSQNVCSKPKYKRHLETLRSLKLAGGQTFLLTPPREERRCLRLFFQHGVARLSGSFGDQYSDITLAFCGDPEGGWLRLPDDSNFLLEALTESSVELHYADQCPVDQDLVSQWLFDLHLVRHPVGSEARLVSLLQLLVSRFGIRRGDGYLLPFSLGHARMAELIGATRSTVTRQITILRKQDDLQFSDPEGSFLLSVRLMEASPTMKISL